VTSTSASTETSEPTQAELAALRTVLRAVTDANDALRDRVRERALQGYHDRDWTLDQLNSGITKIGLEPHEPRPVTRAELDIRLSILADTDDGNLAVTTMRCLDTQDGRQFLRNAITQALKAVSGTGPALSVLGSITSASIKDVTSATV